MIYGGIKLQTTIMIKSVTREFSPKLYVQFSIKIRMCIYTSRAAFVCDGQGETDEKGFHHGMWERWLKITLTTIITHVLTSQ